MAVLLVTGLLAVGIVAALLFILMVIYDTISFYWLTPIRIRKIMEKQSVRGPKPQFLVGNVPEIGSLIAKSTDKDMDYADHNVVARLMPHYVLWSKIYGKRFLLWNATEPRLCLTDVDKIDEFLKKYPKATGRSWLQRQGSKHFIGNGLLNANGDEWYHQRHILAPVFMGEKLRNFYVNMKESTNQMIERLDEKISKGQSEFEIGEYLKQLSAEIIAKFEFGPEFEKGRRIFDQLNELQALTSQSTKHLSIPGGRFLPTKYNRQKEALRRELHKTLMAIIQGRKDFVDICQSDSHGEDLLGVLLDEMRKQKSKNGFHLNLELIMDELKTFYFAGHETTSLLLTWTIMLLATNPLWQDKVREEVKEICGSENPSLHHVTKFNVLNMVINESLRLYPSATSLPRMAFRDIQLGDLLIPKGLSIWIPSLAINHDEKIWGPDANEFNPNRFATKVGRHFIPFGVGARNCIGQTFSLMEAKIVLASLIQRFNFTISEKYRHAPVMIVTIQPKYGVQVILKPITV